MKPLMRLIKPTREELTVWWYAYGTKDIGELPFEALRMLEITRPGYRVVIEVDSPFYEHNKSMVDVLKW